MREARITIILRFDPEDISGGDLPSDRLVGQLQAMSRQLDDFEVEVEVEETRLT